MPQQGALANEIVTIGFCGAAAKAALRVDGSAASGTAATQSAMMKENKRLVIITFSPPITTPGNLRFPWETYLLRPGANCPPRPPTTYPPRPAANWTSVHEGQPIFCVAYEFSHPPFLIDSRWKIDSPTIHSNCSLRSRKNTNFLASR